ncbi:family 16 glycoside hydrolase [Dictyobacter aurantiacus]|uniref:3-keto-alpha-glucoside-1,2-lyase/3-keto-2-hydroxy-glucal hydratase domain-containing protein n=1 Tax=Dictyobacter aurantiacus TaxID=1936993 RepID=A0A401ZLE0_9CHLR|nr:family 16 glycoside hydrolase [Dictyobacter aurantiacus]GCE07638.1 hypothetical protein KDAU_49670 [Dictyobacter aurantiacus]
MFATPYPNHQSTVLRRIRGSLVPLLLLCILSYGCASTPSASTATPTNTNATPTPTKQAAGVVLYQSDWSRGLKDWHASAGWKIKGNTLQTDLGENRSLQIPYTPTTSNYSVEYRVQIVSVPKDGGYFMLNADPATGRDGYQAHILNLLTPTQHGYATHPLSEIVIEPFEHEMDDASPQVLDYVPGNQWHTYRVDIRGERALFYIDGHGVSRASSAKTNSLSQGPIRLVCGKAILNIGPIRVLSL